MLRFILLAAISVLVGQSLAWPVGSWADTALGFDLTTDYIDGYAGPWSMDYYRGSRWMGPRGPWSYADYMDPVDYMYGGGYPYPRTADVSKEKYVRDNPYGETEVGVRDSMSFHPRSRYAAPILPRYGFRSMPPYAFGDFDLPFVPPMLNRRMFAAGLGTPRTSSLRTGGDFMYLRR